MFIQVIEGRVRNESAMRQRLETWKLELQGVASGHLGSTHGVTPDGTWISVVRFASEEAARRNSRRPEQGAWWGETSRLFEGDVRFDDCTEVDIVGGDAWDEAGFVQVLRGRAKDKDALRRLLEEIAPTAREGRPHLLGAVYAWHDDDFTNTVYFTSEAEAREGERAGPPPHMSRWLALVTDLRFLDLREPILLSG